MKAVIIGSGQIGLGFIGLKLHSLGIIPTFVEAIPERVALLKTAQSASIRIKSATLEEYKTLPITSVLHTSEAAEEIAKADIVLTAVGAPNLSSVAKLLTDAQVLRNNAHHKKPLGILVLACENLPGNGALLASHLLNFGIPEGTILTPDTVVDCIVTPWKENDHPVSLSRESYSMLKVDKTYPGLSDFESVLSTFGVEFTSNIDATLFEKLAVVNGTHVAIAYIGALAHMQTIDQALQKSHIRNIVERFAEQASYAVQLRYPNYSLAVSPLQVLERFSVSLGDSPERVGRDPKRKLQKNDRVVAAAESLYDVGIIPQAHILTAAAGMKFANDNTVLEAIPEFFSASMTAQEIFYL